MSTTARLTVLEGVVARLADRRGVKISELMRRARASAIAGEALPHAALYDITVLTAEARQPGLRGQLARARLRLIEGGSTEGLLSVWSSDASPRSAGDRPPPAGRAAT